MKDLEEALASVKERGNAWREEFQNQGELHRKLILSRRRLEDLRRKYEEARASLEWILDPLAQTFRALEKEDDDATPPAP